MHRHGGDIYSHPDRIDYSANINYLGMPQAVREAAMMAVDKSVHYPDTEYRELKAAIAKKDGVLPEQIFCGNGAADVILSLVRAKRPRRALLPIPSFYEYEQALRSADCGITDYLLRESEGFVLTERILDQITEETDILFLCNPNNPTGELVSPKLMQKILQKCGRTGTLLVVDECFNEFLEEPEKHTMLSFLKDSRQLFILKAFTKMYAMPGLRLGYGLSGDTALLAAMEEVSQPWRVSVPAQAAGAAAARETEFVRKSRRETLAEKEKLLAGIHALGYQTYGSRANYIFFAGERDLAERMEERGFLIRDCANYRGLEQGYYRTAVRGGADNAAFLEALRDIHMESESEWQERS